MEHTSDPARLEAIRQVRASVLLAQERPAPPATATEVVAIIDRMDPVLAGPHRLPGRAWLDVVAGLPGDLRRVALDELFERAERAAGSDAARPGSYLEVLATIEVIAPGSVDLSTARRWLAVAARQGAYYPGDHLLAMARVLRAHGHSIPPEVVAVMRRTGPGYQSNALVADVRDNPLDPILNPGEAWADRALADLAVRPEGWRNLVAHALTATTARPNARWERAALALVDPLGVDLVRETLVSWVVLVGRARTITLEARSWGADPNHEFDRFNATALRGLVWVLGLLPADAATARALGGLVETCLRKVPGLGPRNPKVANSAVWALSRLDGEEAVAQLARLAARVTFKGTLKEVGAALDTRAAALGLTRDEVEELAVPAYGLTEVGRRVDRFGDATAELEVVVGATRITWRTAAGKVVKAPPAAVRADHREALAEFKAAGADIAKMLTAQVERLDRQFLNQRTWAWPAFRDRLLDHPLVGTIARRLIWLVDGVACGWADGALRHVDDSPVEPAAGATVALWHPIDRSVDEVLAWRAFVERHAIVQPTKQAHREVYPLTDAERATRVYSNRFASHVLRQYQFHSLAALRGWRHQLRMMVDDSFPPAERELPQWGLRAEFWVDGIGTDWPADVSESGAYLRLGTDQVRFYRIDAPHQSAHAGSGEFGVWGQRPEPVPLDEIPALVLSEVLRDVDLFVGVASVGNDPTWQDGGPDGRYVDYWRRYSFGDLGATAETRRELLTRLVPRLAIADRARVDGRFLVVRGDLRTYKIHIGSGNILMEPNDQYLCIVPDRSHAAAPQGVFLPFEGDQVLAIILSKALMLARDTAITDATITHQIRR